MKKGRTYYEILGVTPDAPGEVISAAFRAQMLSLRKHPDLGGDTAEAAALNEAHEVLTDPAKRKAYDATLETCERAAPRDDASKQERRRARRFQADAPVSFCISHDNNWHTARVTDYSVLGVRLRSHTPLKEGQRIVIAPTNLASFALHGTIKWSRAFHPTLFERIYEAGVEFADQITDIEQRLTT